ncbi:partition protein [Bacillus phage vB_BmeM-Goe8]|uniref:Uncharacterized protein n=1 Tax=Bacillus phage vB_BmeM-Goe8 TaxID=2593638 RepID=A0A516KMY5_9CAUD|nr:partition protein [Bacillus phage vB_BmeM-Goe8]QDP42959.1 hypothetical protein Goe8_c01860 [Bacillus phage vB_BmeM-Goe8]
MRKQDDNVNVKALDDGYGDTKYDKNGTPEHIPSFVTSFKPKPKDDFSSDSKLKYIAVEIDNERYVVGDYAMKLDPDIRWNAADHKHSTANFDILLKTSLGLMSSGHGEVIDLLMMNLPLKFDVPDRRFDLMRAAAGPHEVGISFDGVNFVKKNINVENVDIKKQGFGSLCDIMLDDVGEIADKDLARGFNVIVDIGSRTLNILTVDALEEQGALSTQDNQGMFKSYLQIGRFLEDELGTTIPDGKLPAIIRAREIRGRDISQVIDRAYEIHANNIVSTLNTVLLDSWAFVNNVIFTGGGAEVLTPHLAGKIDRANVLTLGRYSNVRGLRKYGLRSARKNIKRNVR